jgi:hypothetical protein
MRRDLIFPVGRDARPQRKDEMKKLRGIHILKRGEQFLCCWKELVSEETVFCGIGYDGS